MVISDGHVMVYLERVKFLCCFFGFVQGTWGKKGKKQHRKSRHSFSWIRMVWCHSMSERKLFGTARVTSKWGPKQTHYDLLFFFVFKCGGWRSNAYMIINARSLEIIGGSTASDRSDPYPVLRPEPAPHSGFLGAECRVRASTDNWSEVIEMVYRVIMVFSMDDFFACSANS